MRTKLSHIFIMYKGELLTEKDNIKAFIGIPHKSITACK